MKLLARWGAALLLALTATVAAAQDLPVLKAAVLEIGTVNWELDTIRRHGLDEKHGFKLEVEGMAGNPATRIAFQGGEADIVVADWIWVARQRADGRDFVFIPYSKAVGGLMVKEDSDIQSIADLKGKTIGIAGGPVDKSWLLLQALAQQEHGFDLAAETEQVFGAPPLIFKSALSGEVDAALNFWHFGAKMEAAGMRNVVSVGDVAQQLGLNPETPLLGYVVKGEMLRDNPELIAGFAAASAEAKELLASDDAEWDTLRPMMNASDDKQFDALVVGWREGIPGEGPVDEADAAAMLEMMSALGGEKLVGQATEMPDGVFMKP